MPEKSQVLIVDDDPEVLKTLQLWLKNEGFKVFTAANKKQAEEIVKTENIAVCLVDLHLKHEDGLLISAALKSLDELLRIIILTGYPTYESAIDAIKTGLFDYLSKSTDNDAILRKINSAVEERDRELAIKQDCDKNKISIVLIGHHLLFKEGLENFLKENMEYCLLQTYHAIDYVKKSDFNLDPALLLICASCNQMFLENPENIFTNLKIIFPNAKMVLINCDYNDDKKRELIRCGAKGFLPANTGKANLKKALNCILEGQIWISRELSHQLLSELLEDSNPEIVYRKPLSTFGLTNREIEILQALASGLSNFAISEKLFLSEKTVKTHAHHIFKKMLVKTRTQAVMKAMEFHII
ncbi:MAG: DNA-binding response regulator [Candidatus Aminicenantes bacterium]|nr:DNA-binding response regulator [Candidatus Aminicenantes bacterium]